MVCFAVVLVSCTVFLGVSDFSVFCGFKIGFHCFWIVLRMVLCCGAGVWFAVVLVSKGVLLWVSLWCFLASYDCFCLFFVCFQDWFALSLPSLGTAFLGYSGLVQASTRLFWNWV